MIRASRSLNGVWVRSLRSLSNVMNSEVGGLIPNQELDEGYPASTLLSIMNADLGKQPLLDLCIKDLPLEALELFLSAR